jgi:hypothetical protein
LAVSPGIGYHIGGNENTWAGMALER